MSGVKLLNRSFRHVIAGFIPVLATEHIRSKKSAHVGSTGSFALLSTPQISDVKVSCMTVYFLILERICSVASTGISQAKLLTQPPISVGTQVQRRAKFMGRTIDYVLEVRTLEPDHLMVMESIKSPFPMHMTYQFDALDPGTTRATIRVQGTARTFYGLADFLMAPMVKRNLQQDLRRLKATMERE